MKYFSFFLSTLLLFSTLNAINLPQGNGVANSVVANDTPYYKHSNKEKSIEILFPQEHKESAREVMALEGALHSKYEEMYDWKLDERLYVGLISSQNQIANGFSTQFANNRQINYLGGTQLIDYFCTTSWLDTLIYHESAHNYQANVKANPFSRFLHSFLGNGTHIVPIFTLPNLVEHSFMLEGNAVLNESWHGNGGRLYSGRFKALTLLQAKAGKLKASSLYNAKSQVDFPYGESNYILGGFYNYYLAKKYGLKRVNSYFKKHSMFFWWPFFVNRPMYNAVGINFENSLEDFAREYADMAKGMRLVQGESMAHSQHYSALSSDAKEIFFFTQESGVATPELLIVNKSTKKVSRKKGAWSVGKIIKNEGIYYTQGSHKTSVTKISQGLFNENVYLKEGSESKMVQAYLSDGRALYFDVKSSFSMPQLYVGDAFFAEVNSGVIVDKEDNIYYFKQNAKKRTLYKNKMPLYTYEGFYGLVCDVDSKGGVYFVANTQLGSSLFKYDRGEVTQVLDADNVLEARLINDAEVLVSALSENDYYYVKTQLKNLPQTPFPTRLFFEKKKYYGSLKKEKTRGTSEINLQTPYNSLLDMHYSGSDLAFSYNNGLYGSLNMKFADPLSQNALNMFVYRDETNASTLGVTYSNALWRLQYSLSAYGIVDKTRGDKRRDVGFMLESSLGVYEEGRDTISLEGSFYQDEMTQRREPLNLSLNFSRSEVYGHSMFYNSLHFLSLYGVKEREDSLLGGSYSFKNSLPYEFYLSFGAKYSYALEKIKIKDAYRDERGVKMAYAMLAQEDKATIIMPTSDFRLFLKSAGYAEIEVAKVFNFSAYFFTFPLSLQREALYVKYRHYELESFNTRVGLEGVNELSIGIRADLVLLNVLAPLPLSLEYYHNDNKNLTQNEKQLKFSLGVSF